MSTIPSTTERPSTAPPRMLNDLMSDCQCMSATLPPDGWDEAAPTHRIQRRRSGSLSLNLSRSPSTRRAVSAPAAAAVPSSSSAPTGEVKRGIGRYYARRSASMSRPGIESKAERGTALGLPESTSTSATSLISHPPTPTSSTIRQARSHTNSESSTTSPSSASPRRTPGNNITPARLPLPITPSPSSTSARRNPRINTALPPRLPLPVRPIPRAIVRSSSTQNLLSPHRMIANRMHTARLPSPLRMVSVPGDMDDDIELLPRGLPSALYELPGPRGQRKPGRWWRKWVCC